MSKRGETKGGEHPKRKKRTRQGKVVEKSNGGTYKKIIVYKKILT
jgi:hypothetical protein